MFIPVAFTSQLLYKFGVRGVYPVKRGKIMKLAINFCGIMILCAMVFTGCTKENPRTSWSLQNAAASGQLKYFIAEKEAQANALAKAEGKEMLPEFKALFAAANKGDTLAVTNIFENLVKRAPQYFHPSPNDERLRGMEWYAVEEIEMTFYEFLLLREKYATAFGADIINSIPPGSIYFGDNDPGRFIVTALQKSQINGDPFFTLTQLNLADGTYLDYLRSMYGGKIYIPNYEDSQRCFQDYTEDAKRRLKENKLKAGEGVSQDSNGQIKVGGQVALMQINGLLAKFFFDKNTNHEFYIVGNISLADWMYPHIELHGLIIKINRQPLVELSNETVQQDHVYWTKYVTPMIGDWLNAETPLEKVTMFAEQVYLKRDFNGFKVDPQFVENDHACLTFSLLRSALADIYFWRMNHAADDSERKHMAGEADFAFRQAIALCPYSPDSVFRYVNFLLSQNRLADALLIAKTAAEIEGQIPRMKDNQYSQLVQQIEQYQKMK